ncbi:toll/interleukin-1 receptor domain-containing protein [Streptomyces sp. NPDC005805]|uniref:toll/interleukin-1 receptor domain-containing protein n=1 Tax=Streptomyces sp. NPDC005805 TaxID=3157068 RepID=UPI0033FC772A
MSAEGPLAFLSHASDVKESFVKPLAAGLARHGVRSWVDAWEIEPDDSLPRRVFDEGLTRADAIVLIVSPGSMAKPWVREELEAAVYLRVENGRRLITVCLDGARPPLALAYRLWLTADGTAGGAAAVARRVADAIHGVPEPPPPVAAPLVPGLSPADGTLLTATVRTALPLGRLGPLPWARVAARAEESGLREPETAEPLAALESADAVTVNRLRGRVRQATLTRTGYIAGLPAAAPGHEEAHDRILRLLAAARPTGVTTPAALATVCATEPLVVRQLLTELEARRLITLRQSPGGRIRVTGVSPVLHRLLDA